MPTALSSVADTTPARAEAPPRSELSGILDAIGGTLSLACAAHCIALPFVLTLLPFAGLSFLAHSSFEFFMICLSLTIATVSFSWTAWTHGAYRSLAFVIAAATLFFVGHELGGTLHWVVMGVGGLVLALGHFLNHRVCVRCPTCAGH